ncbi:MAG: M1 family metallopeptidase [Planctomycetes bacterium]|nr:M1 family metallopeptidase [Planctomycetota bacterium]
MLSRLLLPLVCCGAVAAQDPIDALHYRLEIEIVFATQTIQATNHCTFRCDVPLLTTIDLDLVSALNVSGVRMNGQPVPFTRPTDTIRITLDRAYTLNETFTVDVTYAGTPPPSPDFGGFVFTSHSGSPMAWTLSEPWDAKYWWPGQDQLVDKSTFEMWITHPDTMTAVSNGALQGIDTLSGNRLRTRWSESHPIVPYLASLCVTNYRTRTDTYTYMGANMPVTFWVFPESWNSWQAGMNAVVPMLTAFSSVYGQYPWTDEKYGVAQFTWGGGMEHQTVASQYSIDEWLTAHELAHQWWGDMITCGTWHDIWLNEGFASFSEAVWMELRAGGTLQSYLSYMRGQKPRRTTGTVYVYDISSVNNIFSSTNVYDKGAWAVHMLRGALGEQDFWASLANYRQMYAGGSATTADFQAVCEQTSGRDLDWFFDQWIYNGGNVAYQSAWRGVQAGGRNYAYLELDQYQTSRPVFAMPVHVVVTTTAGTEEHIVWNDERQQEFAIPINAPATAVAVDPDEWILRGTNQALTWRPEFFGATASELDVTNGGTVGFHIDRGAAYAGRTYFVLMSLSGSTPGTNLFGLQVPINWDALTTVAAGAANTPGFTGFYGPLDAAGRGVAEFTLPAMVGVPAQGSDITVSALFVDSFDWASRPVRVTLR